MFARKKSHFSRFTTSLCAVAILLTSGDALSTVASAQGAKLFTLYKPTPVVSHGSSSWDNRYTNPGAVFFYKGTYYMFRSAFNSWPAPVAWGLVTSPDGYNWTEQGDQPIFTTDQVPYAQTAAMASSAMVTDDGTWVIYFYTDGAAGTTQVIGRATAPAPQGPWKADPQPILKPGSTGAWDDVQVTRPSVVRTGSGYVMYYEGLGDKYDFMVGMATSTDGIHWTKYNDPSTTNPPFAESDPVVQPNTDPNVWDANGVGHPHVQMTPDGWVMLYRGGAVGSANRGLGIATSRDGLHWDISPQNPVIRSSDVPNGTGIYDISMLYNNGTYFVYFEDTSSAYSDIYLATHTGSISSSSTPVPGTSPTAAPTGIPTMQQPPVALPGNNSQTFQQTGKTVKGLFLDYWNNNGGLAQQGYPISDLIGEVSQLDGKTYTVQYFERSVMEYHPENQPPYNVLLSQLGTFRYKQKYPNGAPGQTPNSSPGSQLFAETGHRVGGKFLDYWKSHGGLAQQGLPISDEFTEVSDLDGKPYTVQYFERAVFEMHPENKAPYDILLSQLGTFQYKAKYGDQ